MKKIILITLLLTTSFNWANNLTITNITKIAADELQFTVSWDNAWNVPGLSADKAWIFIKAKGLDGKWHHVDIVSTDDNGGISLNNQSDNKGFFIGNIIGATQVTNALINVVFTNNTALFGPIPDFKVFGIEMVYIKTGAYYLGDGASSNRYHQGNDDTLPYYVSSSNEMTFGNAVTDINAMGTSFNNIPADFPKGYERFYTTKYEITQQQYVEFLNTLTAAQQQTRTASDLTAITTANRFVIRGSFANRNGIACDANTIFGAPITFYCDLNDNEIPNESDDGQNIACDNLTGDDLLAYLDWAALSPMTDMEFEKVCRGKDVYPIAGDFPNGTTLYVKTGAIVNAGQINETVTNVGTDGLMNDSNYSGGGPLRVGALATSTSNRLQSGGSYYGVMDLGGNLSEYCLRAVDNTINATYTKNMNGDGLLTEDGTQDAWSFLYSITNPFSVKGGNWRETNSETRKISNKNSVSNTSIRGHVNIRGCRYY